MADGMVKADAAPIVQAVKGELKFTDGKVLVPVAKAAVSGALGVTLTRYWGNDWFPEYKADDNGNPTTERDKDHKLKRGAFKIAAGVGAVNGATLLAPWIYIRTRSTTPVVPTVDYIATWGDRN